MGSVLSTFAAILGVVAGLITIWDALSEKGRYQRLIRVVSLLSRLLSPFYVLVTTMQAIVSLFGASLPFVSDMPQIVQVMGMLLTLSVIISLLIKKKRPISDKKEQSHPMGDASYRGQSQMEELLINRSEGADEVVILGGKGTFLNVADDASGGRQYQEILKDPKKYRILLNDMRNTGSSLQLEALNRLRKGGAEIKAYPNCGGSDALRGRLVIGAGIYSAVLCNNLGSGRFGVLELRDSNLVRLLYDFYKDMLINQGTNVFIKYVCFDLAGVFYSGNIGDFYNKLKSFGVSVDVTNRDHLLVGKKVNIDPDYTIVEHLKDLFRDNKSVRAIIEKRKSDIITAWNTTWKINKEVQKVATELKKQGYDIAICSNCDGLNGERYKLSGEFKEFDTFLSYDVKHVKPDKEYFDCILERYNCFPYEVLFIDDHKENTDQAKLMGFETIYVIDRDCGDSAKAEYIVAELEKLSIRIDI